MKYIKMWIAFSMVAAGISFLVWMMTAEPSESSSSNTEACASIDASALKLVQRMKTLNDGSFEYRQNWLTAHNMVVASPSCFTAEAVAASRASLQNYLGH